MNCLLCLESTEFPVGFLHVSSADEKSLEVKAIILQHFWFQDGDLSGQHTICSGCWQYLKTFHQFYLRIKSAHDIHSGCNTRGEQAVEKRKRNRSCKKASDQPASIVKIEVEKNINKQVDLERESVDAVIVKNELKSELDINEVALKEQLIDANSCSSADETKEGKGLSCIGNKSNDPLMPLGKNYPTSQNNTDFERYDKLMNTYIEVNCSLCKSQFTNFQQLKTHSYEEHNTKTNVLCCGQKLRYKADFIDHVLTHLNPQHFQCSQCKKSFANRNLLRKHCIIHRNNRVREHRCEVCLKTFFRRGALKEHAIVHIPEETKTIACTQCDKKFANDNWLQKHIAITHMKKYVYEHICEVCGKVLKGAEAWKQHQEEHAPEARDPIRCQLCGFESTSKKGLYKHMRNRHSEENLKTQVCAICAKVSSSVTAHKRHVKYMHNTKPKHNCTMCEKTFKRLSQLREHTASHTGEVLYTCPHCTKTYNSKSNWHSHIKKVHYDEWKKDPSRQAPKSIDDKPNVFV